MTRVTIALWLALTPVDGSAVGALPSVAGAMAQPPCKPNAPVRFEFPSGNHLLYVPTTEPPPPATSKSPVFTTIVKGEEQVSVPAVLGDVQIFAVVPQAVCDPVKGACKQVQDDKGKRTLPYPDIRHLPPDGRLVKLQGAPEGTQFLFQRARKDVLDPAALPSVTMVVATRSVQTLVEPADEPRSYRIDRLVGFGPGLPPTGCPPGCDPITDPGLRLLVFVDGRVASAVHTFDASLGLPAVDLQP